MNLIWEQTEWPDTELDRRAYEQAKRELGTSDLSALLQRAQQIKAEWKDNWMHEKSKMIHLNWHPEKEAK
jgi:hypothetical protein